MASELLKRVAADMWALARERGQADRTLSGGLRIVCKVADDGDRRLGLLRPGGWVEASEAVIAAAAFGVPIRCKWQRRSSSAGDWRVYIWRPGQIEDELLPFELWPEPYDAELFELDARNTLDG